MKITSLKNIFVTLIATALFTGIANAQLPTKYEGKPAKYVFLFIGDGMSFPQVASFSVYKGTVDNKFVGTLKNPTPNSPPKSYSPYFETFPVLGVAKTHDASKFITDSAAASTAIATGHKTLDGRLGLDITGKSVPSIATLLKQNNYKVGIVTTASIDDATPAGFYAHQNTRSAYYAIGLDLINSNFDYFGGGGFIYPQGRNNDQPSLFELAKPQYQIVDNKDAILKLKPSSQKIIAFNPVLDENKSLPFSLENSEESLTLADFTRKGIELLQDNKHGFFMMIEGGKIDWAAHANDALSLIKDVDAFEQAINEAINFQKKHPDDTLIVVTGDHETGGLTIGFGGTEYDTFFNRLNGQTISYEQYERIINQYREQSTPFSTVLKDLEKYYGLIEPQNPTTPADPALVLTARELTMLEESYHQSMTPYEQRNHTLEYVIDYSMYDYEPLQVTVTHILNNKAGIGWTSSAHTGLPVPVYALGVGKELFSGLYENTGIFDRIKLVTKIE